MQWSLGTYLDLTILALFLLKVLSLDVLYSDEVEKSRGGSRDCFGVLWTPFFSSLLLIVIYFAKLYLFFLDATG